MEGQEIYSGAVIPARPTSPPAPPPPASGNGVAQRSTVDVTGATEALVVGPRDVLIISYPATTTMRELYELRDRLRDSDLRDGQILLIAGAEKMVKVEGDPPQRYVCEGCGSPIVRGERCARCGRGWLVRIAP